MLRSIEQVFETDSGRKITISIDPENGSVSVQGAQNVSVCNPVGEKDKGSRVAPELEFIATVHCGPDCMDVELQCTGIPEISHLYSYQQPKLSATLYTGDGLPKIAFSAVASLAELPFLSKEELLRT